MPALDAKVAAIIDKAQADDSDEDALIAELENDDALDAFREQRRQQLHAEFERAQQLRNQEHGTYVEIKEEKQVEAIKPNLPRVTDLFQTYLRELRPSDLNGSAGLFRLKEELTKRVNNAVAPQQVSAALSAAQVLPALVGALLGIPAGIALLAAVDPDQAGSPPLWQLLSVVPGTVLVVAALAAVPAVMGARRPAAEILQSELA